MPSGTGAATLNQLPPQPFVTDPQLFFQLTEKNVTSPRLVAAPGAGVAAAPQPLLQTGVVSKVLITFTGTLTVATAAVTPSDQWPYNLLKGYKLSVNGSNDLFSCDGIDLYALRFCRFPAYTEAVDVFPDVVGGGGSVAVGSYALSLTWEVPIAIDDTSLIGSLYLQSSATSVNNVLTQANNGDLFSANPANATIAGNFQVSEVFFEVPYDAHGNLVLPDLSRLHGFNSVETPIVNVGENRTPLVRAQGQLGRLFFSGRGTNTTRFSALPNAATARKLDAIRLEYAGNQRPLVFNPAALLLSINNQHYSKPVPYDRLVFDFLKENPVRDAVILQGLTELAVVPTVNAGATVTAGQASVRIVQETLF